MSTTETARPATSTQPARPAAFDRPTATFPTGRPASPSPAPLAPSPFACWRDQTPTEELPAFPRVSTPAKPTGSRVARHLRSALAGILIAAALLTGIQLYAARGIADARQAALEQPARRDAAQSDVRSDIPAAWVTEGTGAAYDRTDPAASPLYLPRCTTSPDTPLPCLATISPDSRRAVVLEEDASLTALVRR